ncbi:MAG TPA: PD-(D/E)XK nuclease domain-containing protein [Leptospiraceae bacterium]|nr:PD-(D/E)XK nuclease domain-containing protein [Leptospiraceae bacterium]HMZ58985.1 PD-(D/E)XK nuclease domain-containing protein [Leptospiraceae bacterium]HNF12185.1 PD-(D/E)XK nuclease domain-containing protein [Leptospiraceae bacterium]HNF24118.1 PD-(D/E)XK nuclease domain-containing protein [Leptospiraceae bacterium]HNI96045.1 PD-(D/E)XK nuclease domain-containing protein [Leptospiraceae bacterium]
MTVLFGEKVFVFEFKVIELSSAGSALAQIKQRKYYEKYLRANHIKNYLIGVEFSRESRNIAEFEWESLVYK